MVGRAAGALSAEIDGQVVALDIARGACYGLDIIGSRIWALIETPTAITSICEILTESYAVEPAVCLRDVLDLFAELRTEGLIDVHAPAPPPAA